MKNKRFLSVILILTTLICLSACDNENQVTSINSSNSNISSFESNISSSQLETSSKSSKSTSSTTINTSSLTSSTNLKILKPKTIEEGLLPWHEDYDKIERFPVAKIPDMSKTEILKFVEKIYEINLPDSTVFGANGSFEFKYTLLDKYTYDNLYYYTHIKNLITYYTKSEMDSVLKQVQEHEKLGWGIKSDRERFLNGNKQEMEEIVGDLSNKEYYQFDIFSSSRPHTNIQQRIFIFIMKEAENRYMVVFSGFTTNYDFYNGTLEIQPDGSAKAKN